MKSILARNIAQYRRENKLTQEELGHKLGVTYQAVSKWETEQAMPDASMLPHLASMLPHLASMLHVSIDKLMGYNPPIKDAEYYDYESVYRGDKGYYWGVKPNSMCLKILSFAPPDKRLKVLDIGCGEGRDAVFLARCGYDVSAFDVSDAGLEKTKRLADEARVHVNVFKADVCDYRLDSKYDILYSCGVFHYIKPKLRDEILENYRNHTNADGIHALNVFVQKPFVAPSPENEEHSYLWHSEELLAYYRDWFVEGFTEYIFDCNSSGVPHQHAMNQAYARKKNKQNAA